MTKPAKQLLFWTPRILCILFAAFISIFALDVFGHYGFWGTTVALLMHLIPTWIILALLIICWRRWEWVIGIIFIGLGVLYIVMFCSRLGGHLTRTLPIGCPPILIGVLFLINWLYRKELRARS